MAGMVITNSTDIVTVDYNADGSDRFEKATINLTTGQKVFKLKNDMGIETDMLCNSWMQYDESNFDTINSVDIDTNTKLYDEIIKLL